MELAFYCVCDERYFLGAVGMINSLRLQGHGEPVVVLDCGLTREQRGVLAGHVEIVDPPERRIASPHLLKTVAPLARPAAVMVMIDADILAVRPLGPLLEPARNGSIAAIRNDVQRHFAEWGELFGTTARPGPYVSTGLVAMPAALGEEVLRAMESSQERVDFSRTYWRANDPDYPFLYADQDVFNAVLATRLEADALVALDERLAAVTPFGGLEVTDEALLRCAYPEGDEPLVVHFILPAKPWQRPMYHGVYSQLLARLLVGPDLAIRPPREMVPVRFRDGAAGRLARARIHARDRLGWRARALLPDGLLARLDDSRRRRAVRTR